MSSNQLAVRGANPGKNTRFAPLYVARFFSGLWTQRSPLRDAGSTHFEETYYGSRGDGLWDGLNVEISPRLTLIRRPGTSVYNSQTFPAINSFYEFRLFNTTQEAIRIIVDTASGLYDGTGPNTKSLIYPKPSGAGQAYLQSVGNTLYIGDGAEERKWVQNIDGWKPSTTYAQNQFISDSNNFLQLAIGSQTASITAVQVATAGTQAQIFFNPNTPLTVYPGCFINLSGLTTSFLNNTFIIASVPNSSQIVVNIPFHASLAFTQDSGFATTGSGVSSTVQPTWATTVGGITPDGSTQWINRGPSLQGWGIVAPFAAPVVTQVAAPSLYPVWTANTWYGTGGLTILDPNGNLQQLTTGGITGGGTPSWATSFGSITLDGSVVWTNVGSAARFSNTAYRVGQSIVVTWTYYITTQTYEWNGHAYVPVQTQTPVTTTALFLCATAGTTSSLATNQVSWSAGVGTSVRDGSVVWTNSGTAPAWFGATQTVSTATTVLDANRYLQRITNIGKSGSSAPTWQTAINSVTVDNQLYWTNSGPFGSAVTGSWQYAYSYQNSITGAISTASPLGGPIQPIVGNQPVIQGLASPDAQVDSIIIWRTVQGGSILFYLDQVPNGAPGSQWIYTDTTPDTQLNEFIEAPIALSNAPPPKGFAFLAYHLGRVWGAVENTVYYSGGPDTIVGNGNEAFPPSNHFVFPSQIRRLFPASIGLLVFTNSDIYIIGGSGTSASPFTAIPYMYGVGLASYNAFDVHGTTVYMYTTNFRLISLDVSSGYSNIGLPIGDQFTKRGWTPDRVRVTWHTGLSSDDALYVSDGSSGWFRMCPTPAPEVGLTWSPIALLAHGCSAIQSVETTPGTRNLLIGPRTSGPILQRSLSTYTDNGTSYNAWTVLGSIVLCQPGQLAEVSFITTKSIALGTRPKISVQLDEILPYSDAAFEPLTQWTNEPPELVPSLSLYCQRFYLEQQSAGGHPALCQDLQIAVDWGIDSGPNELLSLTIFGSYSQEA